MEKALGARSLLPSLLGGCGGGKCKKNGRDGKRLDGPVGVPILDLGFVD